MQETLKAKPNGQDVPDLQEERPLNVLILGETANGKSTLIRQLSVYAGNATPQINIGYGNVSCTTEVGRYPISTPLRSYYLQDPEGREVKNVEYTDLVDFTDDDATIVEAKPDNSGKQARIDLIDTPGLDDSDGNDMQIMTDIISRVGELSHLNAVIYVRSIHKPFGTSFTHFYDYIQRCLPMVSSGLIVVHTGFTVEKIEEAISRKRDLAAERRDAFQKATKGSASLAHFFMDNNPDESNPFAMAESLNGCYKLLSFLSSQRPLDITNLKLLKAPNMSSVDSHVLLALERLRSRLQKQLDEAQAAASQTKNRILRMQRELERLKVREEEDEGKLGELDRGASIVLGTKTVAEDYGFKNLLTDGALWLDRRDVSFDGDCTISSVTKTAGKGCRWLDEDLRGTSWRARLTSSIFRSMEGTATFYTTSALKHRGEISHLRQRLSDDRAARAFHQAEIDDAGGADAADGPARELAADVDRCARLIERVGRDTFEAVLWPLLRPFYVGHQRPSNNDIVEFVTVYDPATAELLFNF